MCTSSITWSYRREQQSNGGRSESDVATITRLGGQPLERHQPIATAILEKQQNNRTTVSVVKSGVANTTRLDGDRSKDINH